MDKNIILFDEYWSNEMEVTERVAFEERLRTDVTFQKEYNFHVAIIENIKKASTVNLQKNMNNAFHSLERQGFFFSEEDIEDYLFDELSDEDKKAFEARLGKDPEFAKKVEFERKLTSAIKQHGNNTLQENLNKAFENLKDKNTFDEVPQEDANVSEVKTPTRIFRLADYYRPLAAAASILLVIGVGMWWYNNNQKAQQALVKMEQPENVRDTILAPIVETPKDNNKEYVTIGKTINKTPINKNLLALSKEYAKIEDDYILGKQESGLTPNSRQISENLEIFYIGLDKFTNRDYKEARSYFLNYISHSSELKLFRSVEERKEEQRLESHAKFYLAVIEMENNHFKSALKYLEPLKKENKDLELIDKEVIYFYTALCYIQTNQLEQAIDLFEKIEKSNTSEKLKEKAKKLLSELKK